ncbi:MAG: TsoY family (seleno)protein [Chloroflexaceae bacterium]
MVRRIARLVTLRKNLGESYTPVYFLSALGNGGMAVAFFIYLNFMVPHPETPIITFDGLTQVMAGASLSVRALILTAMAGIAFFGIRHLWLLVWNLREYARYRNTAAFTRLRQSNSESKLIGLPLTLAMTVNMSFAAGATFTPGIWNIIEYLFPAAMLAFLTIGILALRIFINFFSRILANPEFDCSHNNSLGQLKAILTFGLVGVGFSAPAAMSVNPTTVTFSIIGGLFFATVAVVMGLIWMILGFRSMLAHGISKESAVSLWIPLPILTVLGVTGIRVMRGMGFLFHVPADAANPVALRVQFFNEGILIWTTLILSVMILFAVLGYAVMKRVNYFETFVSGPERSADSYALICPGTAIFVFGMFFVHMGLVRNDLLDKFSPAYFIILVPFIIAQLFAIHTMLRLDEKLLRPGLEETAVVDEGIATA